MDERARILSFFVNGKKGIAGQVSGGVQEGDPVRMYRTDDDPEVIGETPPGKNAVRHVVGDDDDEIEEMTLVVEKPAPPAPAARIPGLDAFRFDGKSASLSSGFAIRGKTQDAGSLVRRTGGLPPSCRIC